MTKTINHNKPFLKANAFSRFYHCWLSPLITKSQQQGTLHIDDLYGIPSQLESEALTDELDSNWANEVKQHPENPSLIRATLRTAGWRLPLLGLLVIPLELLNVLQPFLLIRFMKFFEPCSTMSVFQACTMAAGIILALFCINTLFHQYVYRMAIQSIRMRVAYSGLIFRKVLRLSSHAMTHFGTGEITNLIGNDAHKVELVHYFFNYLWIAPLQIIAVIFLLWHFIKYITFIAIGYTIFLLMIQPLFSRLFLYLRTEILKITDERAKIMSEIIKSMRIVKMYCWESAFEKHVCHIRTREMIKTMVLMLCTSVETVLSHSYVNVAFLFMYGAMWSLNIKFDTGLFTLLTVLLTYTRQSSINYFNFAIRDVLNYVAAQRRIRKFLLLDESERDNRLLSTSFMNIPSADRDDDKSIRQTPQVLCDLRNAAWDQNERFTLKNIRFDAQPGDLICIIGPVGSGKSSLLQTLTGEITHFDGKVRLHGSFCYVPQESWIFSSSVKNNILFGKEYDKTLFQRVVHVTALDSDFAQLTHGANTLVGDQGVMLSGGQKARVNMARALYRDADIYLLDDPLSAVDAKVSKHLFEKSIKRYLHDKICILVTHQIQFLQDATKIIVLDNGELKQMGSYNELLASSSTFAQLLEDINQYEHEQHSSAFANQRSIVSSIYSEKETTNDEEAKILLTYTETKQEGTIHGQIYVSYLQAGIGIFLGTLLIVIIFGSHQILTVFTSWWLAAWSNDESRRYQNFARCEGLNETETNDIYQMTDAEWNQHRNRRFYIFSGLVGSVFLMIFIRTVFCRLVCLNAARVLHNKMFKRILRCPILFFDTNPVGRILNRFTSDVASMDDSLPATIFEFVVCFFHVFGSVALVGLLNKWSFIPAVIALVAMLFVRYRCAPCSRDLKRLAGTTRSPVYSQMTSSVHGLKVIRSYHAENICKKEFHSHLDNTTRVSFLIATLNRWSAMRFDFVSLIFISFVIILAIIIRLYHNQFSTVEIALTLTYSLTLMGLFQWTIRQSVEVESQMTSVERVLEYCSLDQEPTVEPRTIKIRVPTDWPSQGRIVFDNVSMSYSKDASSPLALQHVSLIIESGEKIGIVGRTGAGKSSFIQTLFRMGTIVEGHIYIDGIDITAIALEDVRRRISIIPQDPILFTGTMRSNLDPFSVYSDEEIWNALEQVQLKELVINRMTHGLHSVVSESGSNLSVGQKQLVCLARAILKRSKILVIDEATANVDNVTDELIQNAIREKFKECTVLTVAHRLRTVIDSDRILVLNNGLVAEFDSPHLLLSSKNSHFSLLVDQTGTAEAEYLRTIANANVSHIRQKEQSVNLDNDSIVEYDESDPLVC